MVVGEERGRLRLEGVEGVEMWEGDFAEDAPVEEAEDHVLSVSSKVSLSSSNAIDGNQVPAEGAYHCCCPSDCMLGPFTCVVFNQFVVLRLTEVRCQL